MLHICKILLPKISINKNIDNPDYKNKKILDKKIYDLEIKLNNVKSKLDKFYNKDEHNYKKRYFYVRLYTDIFFKYKKELCVKLKHNNVTNAWLKCYQLLCDFNLMDSVKKGDKINYFDNASFPGNFILATYHYYITIYKGKHDNFNWKANSLLESKKYVKTPLDDKYNLYKNHKKNWLMNDNNNGDITNINNINIIEKINNHNIDLYTSDLGFSSEENFSKQEFFHIIPNISQILCGLVSLKKNGNMLTKQYTIFNDINIYVIGLLTLIFEQVYLTKPITSRPRNSEIYLVCKQFVGHDNYLYQEIKRTLLYFLQHQKLPHLNKADLNIKFKTQIESFIEITTHSQINSINKLEKIFLNYNKLYGTIYGNMLCNNNKIVHKWKKKYKIYQNMNGKGLLNN